MKETVSNSIVWNAALKTGLVFGLFSSACLAGKQLTSAYGTSPAGIAAVNIVLWILEFAGCIYLMIHYMQQLVNEYDGVTQADTFKYGRRIALCSSLILSAVGLLLFLKVGDEAFDTAFDQTVSSYSGLLDSNSRAVLDSMKENMPQIIFFSQFIRCWLYGIILSAILSRSIPKSNPFADSPRNPE